MEANRKSRYGWMAVGALMCLASLALLVRLTSSPMTARAGGIKEVKKDAPPALPVLDGVLPGLPAAEPPLAEIVPVKAELPPPLPSPKPPMGTESSPIIIPGSELPPAGKPLPPIPEKPPVVTPPVLTEIPPLPMEKPLPPPKMIEKPAPADLPPLPKLKDPPDCTPEVPPLTTKEKTVVLPVERKVAVVPYRVRTSGMTVKLLARQTLGTAERWSEVCSLNPGLPAEGTLTVGTTVSLPADAVLPSDEVLQPLPTLRTKPAPRPRAALPLTGTYPAKRDATGKLVLPSAVLEQLGGVSTVLLSPGSDRCLWLTNQAHLDRLGAKLDKSSAREADVQSFKRLYYAQTVKVPLKEGKAEVNDKLRAFAGLHEDVVLVGIDDHFEVWDAAKWRRYTQAKKAALPTE